MARRSRGIYRIPYAPGTTVEVTGDHLTHDPRDRIDMKGVDGEQPYRIVAAADGVIRYLVDGFSENRPGQTPCNNNYVWIEHPNGEWTKYSHMTKDSVTVDAGLAVGDQVTAGTFLGCEDEVGCASGEHLHFEVATPGPGNPIDADGFLVNGNADNRIPGSASSTATCSSTARRYVAARCQVLGGPMEPVLHVCGPDPPPTTRKEPPWPTVPPAPSRASTSPRGGRTSASRSRSPTSPRTATSSS